VISNNKYLFNVKCKLWDKWADIDNALNNLKNNYKQQDPTSEACTLLSFDNAYDFYFNFCNKNKMSSDAKYVVSKRFFEKYLYSNLSNFTDYLYIPATSSVLLHPTYGNVANTFSPKVGDVILAYYNGNTQYQELNISNVLIDSNNNNKLTVKVTPNLVNNLTTGSYTNTTISQFLLLSKQPDRHKLSLSVSGCKPRIQGKRNHQW
jgi:hypothetical protein